MATRKIIFAHHTITEMAEKVAEMVGVAIGGISWQSFGDGWPKIFIEDADQVRNQDVIFFANFEKPESLFEQFAILYAMPMHLVHSFRVIVPFYPVGTMERVTEYGEIATAKTLARMLSTIPRSPIITIFDIHALQTQFYFDDTRVLPELVSAIPLLKGRIKYIPNVAIAFPDDGAHKRFGAMFPEYPKIVCNKVKMPDGTKVVTIKEGDPRGKYIIMVDDLILSGGTLIECQKVLMLAGAYKISAYATHGVFVHDSWKKFTPDLFDFVWLTDSCPDTVAKVESEPYFEVLSLSPLIAKLL
ncbi:MAG: ribose-phosphate diphosphokinase [Parcubacteria group bacterium]|jgi:ribose-phosphate pyrophosphokinase